MSNLTGGRDFGAGFVDEAGVALSAGGDFVVAGEFVVLLCRSIAAGLVCGSALLPDLFPRPG